MHLHVEEVRFEMNQLIDIGRQTAQGMEWVLMDWLVIGVIKKKEFIYMYYIF